MKFELFEQFGTGKRHTTYVEIQKSTGKSAHVWNGFKVRRSTNLKIAVVYFRKISSKLSIYNYVILLFFPVYDQRTHEASLRSMNSPAAHSPS